MHLKLALPANATVAPAARLGSPEANPVLHLDAEDNSHIMQRTIVTLDAMGNCERAIVTKMCSQACRNRSV